MGFDKHTPLLLILCPHSLLKDYHLSSYTTRMQPHKLSPVVLGGVGNNNTLGWQCPLNNQGRNHSDLRSSCWSFPSTSYSPFPMQQLRGQVTVGAFCWAFGFPSVCISTETVEMLFCTTPSTLRQPRQQEQRADEGSSQELTLLCSEGDMKSLY